MEENHEELPTHHLGLQLVSHLQVLHYVDELRLYHSGGTLCIDFITFQVRNFF